MNRHGFLLGEEVLKIVIAVICLVFLVGFLVKLYYINIQDEELEQAEASLEYLIDEINADAKEVIIYNPGNPWTIVGWPFDGEKPSKCFDWENCLCFCKMSFWPKPINSQSIKERCEAEGFCREVSQKIEIVGNFYIKIEKTPYTLQINENKITLEK